MPVCGVYVIDPGHGPARPQRCLPQVSLTAHATILSTVSRTLLTQTFVNDTSSAIPQARYVFPLFDGVSVVGFTCTINNDRVLHGVVQEKQEARKTYDHALAQGQTAGLLEQLMAASDVFTTAIGNIPASAEIKIDVTYLGELKHDAEIDGIRYTIPTDIAPRYGSQPDSDVISMHTSSISVKCDVEMQPGSTIKSVQSPSHTISVAMGQSPQLASISLTLDSTSSLDKDFVLQVAAANIDNPTALLEKHPTIPGQYALMTTLVPRFTLPQESPEIVFVCDRSGSMSGRKMYNLKSALQVFLKSLPLGVAFNICSFGSTHSFLFPKGSQPYDKHTLNEAIQLAQDMDADMGGTEMYRPVEETLKMRREGNVNLEVFVLTDGQIWSQESFLNLVAGEVQRSNGAIRVFSLGIGDGASSALVEGLARVGNGFAQSVGDEEKLDSKVVRMLKAALTPHVADYTMEVKYRQEGNGTPTCCTDLEEDFELVDKVADLQVDVSPGEQPDDKQTPQPPAPTASSPISLFDPAADVDAKIQNILESATPDYPATNIPTVSPPRILQAPFQIPPLFPFSRTNIYLLVSTNTADYVPETVILRGTSRHGPLELQIPVHMSTVATGETIHQLAARKAVRELEDGTGWLFHAKNREGQDLQDQYRGLFPVMVAREAARLGVQYQVAGRWTSFVAVDRNSGEMTVENQSTLPPKSRTYAQMDRMNMDMLAGSALAYMSPQPPKSRIYAQMDGMDMLAGSALAYMSPSAFIEPAEVEEEEEEEEEIAESARSESPITRVFQHCMKPAMKKLKMVSPMMMMAPAPSGYYQQQQQQQQQPLESPFEKLVALQDFSGFWDWDDGGIIAVVQQVLGEAQAQTILQSARDAFGKTAVAATVVVLAFLRKMLAADRDAWELMADKALGWLAQQSVFGGAREKAEKAVLAVEENFTK